MYSQGKIAKMAEAGRKSWRSDVVRSATSKVTGFYAKRCSRLKRDEFLEQTQISI